MGTAVSPALENYSCGCLLGCVLRLDPHGYLSNGAALTVGEQDATWGSHMSRDQLIDRGRGAPELRKCDEVQDRGKNL